MKQNTKDLVGIGTLAAAGFLLAKQLARHSRAFDLIDRVVLITGASRALGLVLAANSPGTAHASPFVRVINLNSNTWSTNLPGWAKTFWR